MTGETGTGITLTPLTTAMDGNQYRVVMTCTANTCDVFSEPATLAVTTDASYAVQHYREQIDGTHTLIETDNLTGTIAATVTGSYNDYSGSGYVEESTYVDTLLTGTVMSG